MQLREAETPEMPKIELTEGGIAFDMEKEQGQS